MRMYGKASAIALGNWTDEPCYYVDAVDGDQCALLAGPFRTHDAALECVDAAKRLAQVRDVKSVFYAFGTCKTPDGHYTGILNDELNPHGWTGFAIV